MVSSCGGCELPVFIPVISSSSSAGADDSRSSSMPSIDVTRLLSSPASCPANADRKRGPAAVSTRFHLRTAGSAVLLHGRPQACGMELGHVDLHGLTTTRRHDGF